jgi:hypothetical protein
MGNYVFSVANVKTQERQDMQAKNKMHRMVLTALVATGLATLSAQAWTWYPADTFSVAPTPQGGGLLGAPGDGSSFLSVNPPNTGAANRTYNPLIDQPWVGADYGTPTFLSSATVGWSPMDAAGSPSSGSLKLSWNWNDPVDGAGSAAFVFDLYPSGQLLIGGGTLSFDMYVDPSSTPGMYNDYGYFQIFGRNNGYSLDSGYVNSGLASPTTVGTWQHIVVNFPSGENIRALEFQDYSGRNIVGPETVYIDNLQLIPEPSTIAVLLAGGALLVGTLRRVRSA